MPNHSSLTDHVVMCGGQCETVVKYTMARTTPKMPCAVQSNVKNMAEATKKHTCVLVPASI